MKKYEAEAAKVETFIDARYHREMKAWDGGISFYEAEEEGRAAS